jgi:hypothetical protein
MRSEGLATNEIQAKRINHRGTEVTEEKPTSEKDRE